MCIWDSLVEPCIPTSRAASPKGRTEGAECGQQGMTLPLTCSDVVCDACAGAGRVGPSHAGWSSITVPQPDAAG